MGSNPMMKSTVAGVVPGVSSLVGGALVAVTGHWPGFQVVQLLFPTLSGAVGGGIGGILGRLLPLAKTAA